MVVKAGQRKNRFGNDLPLIAGEELETGDVVKLGGDGDEGEVVRTEDPDDRDIGVVSDFSTRHGVEEDTVEAGAPVTIGSDGLLLSKVNAGVSADDPLVPSQGNPGQYRTADTEAGESTQGPVAVYVDTDPGGASIPEGLAFVLRSK